MNGKKAMQIRRLWACLLTAFTATAVCAARFPNAVEKQVLLSGPAAVQVAAWFGLEGAADSSLSLPLGRGDAWAVYLLKRDTARELSNDNQGSPPRFNSVVFSPAPNPSLSISPYWLDLATRAPKPQAGYFSFSSPFLPGSLEQDEPWSRLVRRFKAGPDWRDGGAAPARRCAADEAGVELCVELFPAKDYANNRDGYQVVVTAHAASR